MDYKITKREWRQMTRWVILGVGTFFIYFYLRDKVMEYFPNKDAQLFIGIALLLTAAYFFNITHYGD